MMKMVKYEDFEKARLDILEICMLDKNEENGQS